MNASQPQRCLLVARYGSNVTFIGEELGEVVVDSWRTRKDVEGDKRGAKRWQSFMLLRV